MDQHDVTAFTTLLACTMSDLTSSSPMATESATPVQRSGRFPCDTGQGSLCSSPSRSVNAMSHLCKGCRNLPAEKYTFFKQKRFFKEILLILISRFCSSLRSFQFLSTHCYTTFLIHTLLHNTFLPTHCYATFFMHTLLHNIFYPHIATQHFLSTHCYTTFL